MVRTFNIKEAKFTSTKIRPLPLWKRIWRRLTGKKNDPNRYMLKGYARVDSVRNIKVGNIFLSGVEQVTPFRVVDVFKSINTVVFVSIKPTENMNPIIIGSCAIINA